jgi:hypothetical protein
MPDMLTEEEAVRHFAAATLGLLKTFRAVDNSRLGLSQRFVASPKRLTIQKQPVSRTSRGASHSCST